MGMKVRLTGTDHGKMRVNFSRFEKLNRLLEVIGFRGKNI
jgi:hypothetical protein